MLKWRQWHVCCSFQHICLMLSRCWDCLRSGTRDWIVILRMRGPIWSNCRRYCWSMWRINTAPNIDDCPSWHPSPYQATFPSPQHWLPDMVNLLMIHTICPVMMKNTWCRMMWLKWLPDEVIAQYEQGSFWIHQLNDCRTGVKLIRILMMTTLSLPRLAVDFGNRRSPTGDDSVMKCTHSTPDDPI